MSEFSQICHLLKSNQKILESGRIHELHQLGFLDLRPSFFEILNFLDLNEGSSIKEIGAHCRLRKQTMTSHISELTTRGYIEKKTGVHDKRVGAIFLTEYGKRFLVALKQCDQALNDKLQSLLGSVEIERLLFSLGRLETVIGPELLKQ